MAHYNRIVRKKEKKKELLSDPTTQIQHWLAENSGRLMLAAAAVFLVGAISYGVVYYQKVDISDAQQALYDATGADKSISELSDLIQRGGPNDVVNQARLKLASLLVEDKQYDKAIENYRQAANSTGDGELLNELSLAGEASALSLAGKENEAATIFSKLADSAKLYPRHEALLSMAYASAAAGDKNRAVEALKRLQSESTHLLSSRQINSAINRIERGDLGNAIASLKEAPVKEPDQAGSSLIGKKSVHESK